MKIIGIDPGYERLGISIIEKKGKTKEELLYSDCFITSPKLSIEDRFFLIGKEIKKIIKKYKPEMMAIETLFFNSNQKTVMRVSEVRGIIIYEALVNNLKVFEYTPLQIKIAITGYGRSDKNQIISMIPHLIRLDKKIKYDDEYDAIAVGLTHSAVSKD